MASVREDVVEIYMNKELQEDEIAALSAIYEDVFQVIDEIDRVYEFHIVSERNLWWSMTLQVHLPFAYPRSCSPVHKIFSECMNDADLFQLSLELQNIYESNCGDCILHLWIEEARRTLDELCEAPEKVEENTSAVVNEHAGCFHSEGEDVDKDPSLETYCVAASDNVTSDDCEEFEILSGEPLTDRKSTFQAHITTVHSIADVDAVMNQLKRNRKIQHATHNIMAYRIQPDSTKTSYIFDCDDDGEYQAGGRLKHLLQILNVINIVVVVSRWYGGIQLGPDRFKHINNCARDVIMAYCRKPDDKDGSRGNLEKLKSKKKKK